MNNESNDRYESGMDEWCQLQVFNQAEIIINLVEYNIEGIHLTDISNLSDYDKARYLHYTQKMMNNALLIPEKIAEAHNADVYDIKMENATLIRKAARDIIGNIKGLKNTGYRDTAYLDLLLEALETFRHLFAQWIPTFNTDHYIVDQWGLFNPPGISYNTKDITRIKSQDFLKDTDDDWEDSY